MLVFGEDKHLDLYCCTCKALASWLNPQMVTLCCNFPTSCSLRWLACLGLEGPWAEGDSTCWEQALSRCLCSVYESSLCTMGVCAGGCMVGLSQGCMLLVQVSGIAALVNRKQLNDINHQHHMSVCILHTRVQIFSYNSWLDLKRCQQQMVLHKGSSFHNNGAVCMVLIHHYNI